MWNVSACGSVAISSVFCKGEGVLLVLEWNVCVFGEISTQDF